MYNSNIEETPVAALSFRDTSIRFHQKKNSFRQQIGSGSETIFVRKGCYFFPNEASLSSLGSTFYNHNTAGHKSNQKFPTAGPLKQVIVRGEACATRRREKPHQHSPCLSNLSRSNCGRSLRHEGLWGVLLQRRLALHPDLCDCRRAGSSASCVCRVESTRDWTNSMMYKKR